MADAIKDYGNKLPLDLVPPEMEIAIASVLREMNIVLKKYPKNNWRKGLTYSTYYAAARRHMLKWWIGEDIDPESGLPHLWHAACNLSFLISQEMNKSKYKKYDDRIKLQVKIK